MPVVSSAQGRVETHEVEWGGVKRSFLIAAPEKVAPRKSPPLVIDLHGAFETPQGQRAKSRFDHLAKKENFVVVFPTGMKRAWNTGAGMEKRGHDDVGFLGRIIDYCAVVHNIDTRRVYVTGFSAGGFMAYRMACELPSRIAAIAPVGASIKRRYTSRPSRSLPAIIINGTDDPAVPFQGNRTFLPIEKVINEWMKLNRCDARTLKIERIDRDATDGIHVKNIALEKRQPNW